VRIGVGFKWREIGEKWVRNIKKDEEKVVSF
jgi:hypothetical protein